MLEYFAQILYFGSYLEFERGKEMTNDLNQLAPIESNCLKIMYATSVKNTSLNLDVKLICILHGSDCKNIES